MLCHEIYSNSGTQQIEKEAPMDGLAEIDCYSGTRSPHLGTEESVHCGEVAVMGR